MTQDRKTSNSSSVLHSNNRPRGAGTIYCGMVRFGCVLSLPTTQQRGFPTIRRSWDRSSIRGANGYTVSGQAIFQYVQPYPNQFLTSTDRDFVYAQTEYQIKSQLTALFGFRYEVERGFTQSSSGTSSTARGNYSYTLQVAASLANRFYYTLGSGIEKNTIFGVAATPRASLAYYLFRPDPSKLFSGTKLRANFGTGIKEPSISDAGTSLFSLLQTLSNGPELISQFHVAPIGAERSRTYDGGLEQIFFEGRVKLGITYFHNEFSNLIEYVPMQGLLDLGVPPPIADVLLFGASVNSQAFRAQGVETELEYRLGRSLVVRSGYTYLDAVVQHGFELFNDPNRRLFAADWCSAISARAS